MTTAEKIIDTLGLAPHPEGGHFREIHRDPAVTSIYFLLRAGERSHWHRVGATEIWNWHAGAPLTLSVSENGVDVVDHRLGDDLAAGQRPQATVPPGAWQAAVSLGEWTLAGCAVAPAFDFARFELAPPDWAPSAAR